MSPQHSVAVVSDTHGLLRPSLLTHLKQADLIIHAGDLGGEDVLQTLRSIAPTHAVRGNCDGGGLGLHPTATVVVGKALIYVLHDLGRLDLDPQAAGVSVVISGHSHEPTQELRDGVLYFNPGSAGPRRFTLPISMGWLQVEESGKVRGELMDLEP